MTGIGLITAAGRDPDSVWQAIVNGRCDGVRPLDRFDTRRLPTRIAATIEGFDPEAHFGSRRSQDMDRVTQLALYAAERAAADARITPGSAELSSAGVTVGTAIAGIGTVERTVEQAKVNGGSRVSPLSIPMGMQNATAFQIARRFGAHGPNQTLSTACSSGSLAVGAALRLIRGGDADVVIACGCDAPLVDSVFKAWCSLRVMTVHNDEPHTAFRPFDSTRNGFVLGEGAAAIICEELGHARRRDAQVYGELLGFGHTCDACTLTAPVSAHQAEAMRRALHDARVKASDVAFTISHGTATRMNDTTESQAIRDVFDATRLPYVVGCKPFFGHTMGACGVIELIVGLLAVKHGCLCPTPNLSTPDPACAVPHVPPGGVDPGDLFMTNSFGFGGNNVVLVAARDEHAARGAYT